MYYRIGRIVVAIAVLIASLPLSLIVMERGFGLGSTLTVPTCCLGLWFAASSGSRSSRIGWFAFSSVCLLLLPACPWLKRQIEMVLVWALDFLRGGTLFYDITEFAAILLIIFLPWGVGCLLGWIAARITRRLLPTNDGQTQTRSEYQFTLRDLLVSSLVFGVLTAWLSGTTKQWDTHKETQQRLFLQHFTRSFTTREVTLLSEPIIVEDHTILKWAMNASGFSEYRVVAPISRDGRKMWAAWTYLAYDQEAVGTVGKFGYAEAAMRSGLPSHPLPATEYMTAPNNTMTDGEPELGIRAEIIRAPTVAKAGDTITIVAKTDGFMKCTLVIHPFQAGTLPGPVTAPKSGIVSWDVQLNPTYRGSQIAFEFKAREHLWYCPKTARRSIALDKQQNVQLLSDPPDGRTAGRDD